MYYKLVVLFVQYDTKKYPNSLFYLQKYLNKIKENSVKIIVIDNKDEEGSESGYLNGVTTISGDNSVWEFSGWDKGLQYLKEKNIDYDAILFANDSFLAPSGYDSPLTIINDNNVFNCVENNSIIGNFCNTAINFKIGKYLVNKYTRTHCFMLSKLVVDKIGSLVTVDADFVDKCIDLYKKDNMYFLKDAPICINVKRNLVNNLTTNWHSSFDISKNWELFRMKSLMLLNELTLYTRIMRILGYNRAEYELKDIINSIPDNKKIVCIGASTCVKKMFIESNLLSKNIVAFLDNKAKGKLNDINIYTPEEFIEKNIEYDFAIYTLFEPNTIKSQIELLKIKTIESLYN